MRRSPLHRVFEVQRPAETFETEFESVAQLVDAARAFRSHGCTVSLGDEALSLVVKVPRP